MQNISIDASNVNVEPSNGNYCKLSFETSDCDVRSLITDDLGMDFVLSSFSIDEIKEWVENNE